ncbi:MAG: DUF3533 domain-containing protein [Solirubrobacterales bacterium]
MPDGRTVMVSAAALVAVSLLSLLFIASYAGALHQPRPHDVPIAVPVAVPAPQRAKLDASPAIAVKSTADAASALRQIDEQTSYGAVVPTRRGLTVVVAPAASAAIAEFLATTFADELRAAGADVAVRTVHPLPETDTRGLVGFYTAIGWAIAGYLGATLFGLSFGTSPSRLRTAWRLAALAILGLVVGLGGALLATAIAGYDRGFLGLAAIGLLTVLSVGATTVALQSLLGILGTGVAILIFVVFGNPAAGGAYAGDLLPGIWRVAGQLVPTGAATTAIRDVAYFPAASIAGPVLVMAAWALIAAAAALLLGGRGRGMDDEEAKASLAGVG